MKKYAKVYYNENSIQQVSDFETTFELKPLERGLGNTIGNALRRTILSSVSSASVFAIKIANIDHEFSVLDNVVEDVVSILNNLKKIRFRYHEELFDNDQIQKVSFSGDKAGNIYAKDIDNTGGLEIVNQDQYIASVGKVGALKFEMFIIGGKGFTDFETNKKRVSDLAGKLQSDLLGTIIAVDSDFSPVVKVHYEANELNSSNPIVEERLVLNLKTDGTIFAKDALAEAAKILIAHLQLVSNTENLDQIADNFFEESRYHEEQPKKNLIDLSALDLSVRSLNALRRAQYYKVSDIQDLTQEELENIKNLGKKSVQEILDKLKEQGIELKSGD
ncbi:DNA-directed RNA polymerase subunit alpha [Mesomycoplasma conjunctivae]|uniref:DNA-directed RNA polymerase subunit alpha n=1 Tax=Mesomycoplasma conjunctivae (strain ATCC 25834 / NCTC 10147 / HRC/581) TaxID=572263 RepID=C5J5V6_MESCH|nr:DNA-directed RNA polymerase subunit alpha [Mesomycoplasma conjunctivae]CAT04845.1 DNA-directed RNA polymerase subunit alpha [Mesomycoplasma conjunctivae]VEU65908.1 DNA-directed RNA polymerase subunit alpha [Mesomycoplasma conjunctivae]